MLKSLFSLSLAALVAVSVLVVPTAAVAGGRPDTLELPSGYQPEGITVGPRRTLLVGSIPTGAVYRLNPRTGEGSPLVPGQEGRFAIGMKWDWRSDNLYVAGGPTGKVFVYDANSGSDVAVLQATSAANTFVNDAVVTRRAVYFTDSYRPVIYRLPLGPGGALSADAELEEISLGGDFEFIDGEFNTNGIEATHNGKSLIIVNSVLGTLYQVDPASGDASLIELGDADVTNGDGILLVGRHLYVVQNFFNQIAVVELSPDLSSGVVTGALSNEGFDIPTTIARLGFSLYAVNARFSTEPTPDTEYTVVRVPRF